MAETTNLMPIGQFSALTRLSVRMLRHYDAHGVLVPADVDPFTGYRRYAADQLGDAATIRDLRDAGFGVSAISALLAARGTPTWDSALRLQREALVDELRAAQGRLTRIDRLIDQGATGMSITIERTTIPAMTVLALRGTVPTYSDEGQLWERLMPPITRAGIRAAGPCGVIEHDDEFMESGPDLSVFVPVAPGTTPPEGLELIELPERECLVATVRGSYEQITVAHDLINREIAAQGLRVASGDDPASKVFNLYLTVPDLVPTEELVTQVCEPLS